MGRTALIVLLLALTAGAAMGQQDTATSEDKNQGAAQPAPPVPDESGVYRLSPAITPPVLVTAERARLPVDDANDQRPRICIVSAVIGVDGVPRNVQSLRPNPGPFQDAAIDAVKESKFQPGTLDGKPVPVLVDLRIPFFHIGPPIPRVLPDYVQVGDLHEENRDPQAPHRGDTPPKQVQFIEPTYSDEARRKRIQGSVLLSVLVNEAGNPTDLRVERSLGYGLDEEALEALSKYRFRPGLRDGVPTAMRIYVEMSFHLR